MGDWSDRADMFIFQRIKTGKCLFLFSYLLGLVDVEALALVGQLIQPHQFDSLLSG